RPHPWSMSPKTWEPVWCIGSKRRGGPRHPTGDYIVPRVRVRVRVRVRALSSTAVIHLFGQ
ncbi:hypothetical protein TREMEDRAFT_57991, partial [Tremella mesenterica DSM 1558]|uniref:uncharacterized protein n=1 Tax=Tremella mesenterica (strain ATCC 24925 / CBS 8224 / DSM 1558 / NBRC 9311 / NRRL Y-6157 / RJB 2259-6 / UBC 559-6) TaxID=578456 RepID=UPI00032D342D